DPSDRPEVPSRVGEGLKHPFFHGISDDLFPVHFLSPPTHGPCRAECPASLLGDSTEVYSLLKLGSSSGGTDRFWTGGRSTPRGRVGQELLEPGDLLGHVQPGGGAGEEPGR